MVPAGQYAEMESEEAINNVMTIILSMVMAATKTVRSETTTAVQLQLPTETQSQTTAPPAVPPGSSPTPPPTPASPATTHA